ncbi:hypothetical protein DRW07_10175 [Alteromonas sediminis]|uniref:7TM-DISM receptor extracellular domain-containing protein n=1 Tax=Alteromonas sediminis TaxID=2259342 RepID=A0A3N5XZF4_9ALTE|nr:hypothetical protein [Alteromonas sediminis]RPJ66452.1 hypothetical protein DRW07_10175 [Alteromonas sediminis]
MLNTRFTLCSAIMALCFALLISVQTSTHVEHHSNNTLVSFHSVDDNGSPMEPLPDSVAYTRIVASEFQHPLQLSPEYGLVVEFLAEDLSAKHFTYIRTIPDIQPWFELVAFIPNKRRLSGWKDTRVMYAPSETNITLS